MQAEEAGAQSLAAAGASSGTACCHGAAAQATGEEAPPCPRRAPRRACTAPGTSRCWGSRRCWLPCPRTRCWPAGEPSQGGAERGRVRGRQARAAASVPDGGAGAGALPKPCSCPGTHQASNGCQVEGVVVCRRASVQRQGARGKWEAAGGARQAGQTGLQQGAPSPGTGPAPHRTLVQIVVKVDSAARCAQAQLAAHHPGVDVVKLVCRQGKRAGRQRGSA